MKQDNSISRRRFMRSVGASSYGACVLLLADCGERPSGALLEQVGLVGNLKPGNGPVPIEEARWFVATAVGDGIEYRVSPGSLNLSQYVTADFLVDGKNLVVFRLRFCEERNSREFHFRFSTLAQCSLRLRMPLSIFDQNRMNLVREGAWGKLRIEGERVDPAKVEKVVFEVLRKDAAPVRWCMTPLTVTNKEPVRIMDPVLPKGPLLDEFGQSTLHEWPTKTRSEKELTERIHSQLDVAAQQTFPAWFSRWGGWKDNRLTKGTGFFQTLHDGKRWWLVDPEGYAFWSQGPDCVRVDTYAKFDGLEPALTWLPESEGEFADVLDINPDSRRGNTINYLAANMIRTFGPDGWREKWARIVLAELHRLRFNTVANWSEWEWARNAGFPYVRPLSLRPGRVKPVFRGLPDVFDPEFARDAADYAAALNDTVNDPAFIGYFLMNEPSWGRAADPPAAGMLYVTPECHSRRALAAHLKEKYLDNTALASTWQMDVTFESVASGIWKGVLSPQAAADLETFSTVLASRFFGTLSAACKKVDPNHLNLGVRWAGVPPEWATAGMKTFDVFSINCYRPKVPRAFTEKIHEQLDKPSIIGEFHFGALDVGLPASGIGHVKNQADRGKAYRVYLEDAAANPNCVGAHWFTLYDESALGRFDGENYNIGFLDVCNRSYPELGSAAIASHERIYEVAAGRVEPYDEAPDYLPNLR
jgi:hypothetical protein